MNLMRRSSIWLLPDTLNNLAGSWMWKRLLKSRTHATSFLKTEIGNGRSTLFLLVNWSSLGLLLPLLGSRGFIDFGIPREATVEEVILRHRRRSHRLPLLNRVEEEIENLRRRDRADREDKICWRSSATGYTNRFNTRNTTQQLRHTSPKVSWVKDVWFTHHTPKFSFITWLALHNRLATGVRMQAWNANISATCVFCRHPLETREHLFFSCNFSTTIWRSLAEGILLQDYNADWNGIVHLISTPCHPRVKSFLIKYLFQAVLYAIWKERNDRRHGSPPITAVRLIKVIEKGIKNKISSIRNSGDQRYDKALQLWFSTRSAN
ncbi:uncharacterized protein LOC112083487 [Eutrema salsugineum]|uniref:uncharacterized protein LOC112083487 n=1 Tax=Eutrema salsugineum TaxID=72664 RepID=UPI000CED31E7|nr:uncharacterized protein LOC112083487 [Eutrema salsugineum]